MTMKVGSIVVVKPIGKVPDKYKHVVKWLPTQDEQTPYMIRQIGKFEGGKGVMFEEGAIGYDNSQEIMLHVRFVREILPPEDISEQIEDMMYVPLKEDI